LRHTPIPIGLPKKNISKKFIIFIDVHKSINSAAENHLDLNSWTLLEVGILFNEDKPQEEREYGVLYGKYYQNNNSEIYKKFK